MIICRLKNKTKKYNSLPAKGKKKRQKNIIVYLPKAKKNKTKKYNSLPAKGKKKQSKKI